MARFYTNIGSDSEGMTSDQSYDLDKKYNVGSLFNCPDFQVWKVNPELNYRLEIPSNFQYRLETQWVGQFEPERIIAENASELNQVPLETYAVPQALIRFDENRKELAQSVRVKTFI